MFRGRPHAWKHVAFRCSTAPRKASEWQSRRIRLTTAFSRQWQPAVGAAPLHSPLAGIENHMPWSLSAAAAVAHAPIFDGPEPKPQNRPMPPEPRKSETFSRPTRAVHGLQLGGKCPSSQSHTYSPAVQACDALSGDEPLTHILQVAYGPQSSSMWTETFVTPMS